MDGEISIKYSGKIGPSYGMGRKGKWERERERVQRIFGWAFWYEDL